MKSGVVWWWEVVCVLLRQEDLVLSQTGMGWEGARWVGEAHYAVRHQSRGWVGKRLLHLRISSSAGRYGRARLHSCFGEQNSNNMYYSPSGCTEPYAFTLRCFGNKSTGCTMRCTSTHTSGRSAWAGRQRMGGTLSPALRRSRSRVLLLCQACDTSVDGPGLCTSPTLARPPQPSHTQGQYYQAASLSLFSGNSARRARHGPSQPPGGVNHPVWHPSEVPQLAATHSPPTHRPSLMLSVVAPSRTHTHAAPAGLQRQQPQSHASLTQRAHQTRFQAKRCCLALEGAACGPLAQCQRSICVSSQAGYN